MGMLSIEIIVSSTIYFISSNSTLYFIENLLSAICSAGNSALITPINSKVFGMKNSTEVYGYVCLFLAISAILGPVFAKFVVSQKSDYLVLYWAGALLAIISFIICSLFSEEVFDYNGKENKEKLKC